MSAEQRHTFFEERLLPTVQRIGAAIIRRYVRNVADREDLLNACTFAVYLAWANGRYDESRGSFEAWCAVIIRNRVFSYLRRVRHARQTLGEGEPDLPDHRGRDPSTPLLTREMCEAAVGRLRRKMTGFAAWYDGGRSLVHSPAVLWMEIRRRVGEIVGAAPKFRSAASISRGPIGLRDAIGVVHCPDKLFDRDDTATAPRSHDAVPRRIHQIRCVAYLLPRDANETNRSKVRR